MTEIAVELPSHKLQRELLPLLRSLDGMTGPVLVTDSVTKAKGARKPAAYIAEDLPSIMQLLASEFSGGILTARDVDEGNLKAISSGSRVFSSFFAYDLGIDTAVWQLVSLVARGHTQVEASEMAGFSERHARRKLKRLCREAQMSAFHWQLLAPVFPTSGGLHAER